MSYWLSAGRSLARNVRRRDFARDWLSAGLAADTALKAPEVWIGALFPIDGLSVEMGTVTYRPGNVTPFELYCLRAIAQTTKPETIFEFGTFDGATTLALAQSAPDATVYTLDLPDEAPAPGMAAPVSFETENRASGGVGSCFRGQPEAARITQLLGDSRTFDYTPFEGTVDLIFIDASHEEPFVRSDTEHALRLLTPGGVLLWHDYTPGWPGVRNVIDGLVERGLPVVRLELTSLALLKATGASTSGP